MLTYDKMKVYYIYINKYSKKIRKKKLQFNRTQLKRDN